MHQTNPACFISPFTIQRFLPRAAGFLIKIYTMLCFYGGNGLTGEPNWKPYKMDKRHSYLVLVSARKPLKWIWRCSTFYLSTVVMPLKTFTVRFDVVLCLRPLAKRLAVSLSVRVKLNTSPVSRVKNAASTFQLIRVCRHLTVADKTSTPLNILPIWKLTVIW